MNRDSGFRSAFCEPVGKVVLFQKNIWRDEYKLYSNANFRTGARPQTNASRRNDDVSSDKIRKIYEICMSSREEKMKCIQYACLAARHYVLNGRIDIEYLKKIASKLKMSVIDIHL
jgi:hypothetical protein